LLTVAAFASVALLRPTGAVAQLSDPCEVRCGAVLGVAGVAVAMGATAAVGRARGGYDTSGDAAKVWALGFAVGLGAGIALAGDGGRQRQAVYAAGVGTVAGALAGFGIESVFGSGSAATRVAASLVGAGVGALAAGAYGAISYDRAAIAGPNAESRSAGRLVFRIGFQP
jgi:hypothetical protein